MQKYELCFWVKDDPDTGDPQAVVDAVRQVLEKLGGVVEQARQPEKRFLAYPIAKQHTAFWAELVFSLEPQNLKAFTDGLKYENRILRKMVQAYRQLKVSMPHPRRRSDLAEAEAERPREARKPGAVPADADLDTKLKQILES